MYAGQRFYWRPDEPPGSGVGNWLRHLLCVVFDFWNGSPSQVSPVYSCVLCVFGGSHQPDSLCKITGGVFEPDDSPALFGKGLALGLVSTFFPFVSYTLGLRQMEAGKASVLAFSEPMVAAVAGIVVFGEMLRVENVLGILLIFTALVVLNSRNVKR